MIRWLWWAFGWLVVGILSGILWAQVATPAKYTKFGGNWVMGQLGMSQRFAADGSFVLIALLVGAVVGLAGSVRGRLGALGVLGGTAAALLAGIVAWRTGLLISASAAELAAQAANAAEGATVPDRLGLFWPGLLAAWPIGYLLGTSAGLLALPRIGQSVPTEPE